MVSNSHAFFTARRAALSQVRVRRVRVRVVRA
jgi:hypothetical protein